MCDLFWSDPHSNRGLLLLFPYRDKRDKDKDPDFDLNRVKVKEEPLEGGKHNLFIHMRLLCLVQEVVKNDS